MRGEDRHHSAPLDVVIPTLNAASDLDAALASLQPGEAAGLARELLVNPHRYRQIRDVTALACDMADDRVAL